MNLPQAEIDKRNEAIARFDGWEKVPVPGGCYWQRGESQVSFLDYQRWDNMMPVVEKISKLGKANGWLSLDSYDEPYSLGFIPSAKMLGVQPSYYFWFGELGRDYSNRCFMCSSMTTAYFMAVSDYCLALTTPAGE